MKKAILSLLLLSSFVINKTYSTTTYTVINTADSGPGSLRAAMNSVNSASSTLSPFVIDASGIKDTIKLLSTLPYLFQSNISVSITGPSTDTLVIFAPSSAAILDLGNNTTISNITFTGIAQYQTGIEMGTNTVFNNCIFINNTNCEALVSSSASFNNCQILNNSSSGSGNALITASSITNCIIKNNTASVDNSGTSIINAASISNSQVINNSAYYVIDGASITNSIVKGNSGYAIINGSGITISQSTIDSNSFNSATTTTLAGVITLGINKASITQSTISRNTGMSAIAAFASTGTVSISNSTICLNSAPSGAAAIYYGGSDTLSVNNSTVAYNTAAGNAAGIYMFRGGLQVSNSIILGNSTATNGPFFSNYGHNILGSNNVTLTGNVSALIGLKASDILTGILANNGGHTQTIALTACSYAINAGTSKGSPSTDQRGLPRVDSVDIGAYESQSTTGGYTLAGITSSPVFCLGAGKQVITASATNSPSIQWQVNPGTGTFTSITDNALYSGSQSDTLKISYTDTLNNYQYRIIASQVGACANSDTSSPVTLLVNYPPVITQNPASTYDCVSNGVTGMDVVSAGDNLSYQWQLYSGSSYTNIAANNSNYNGSTTTHLAILISNPSNGQKYRAVVTNQCGTANSDSAITYVFPSTFQPAQPTIAPSDTTVLQGEEVTFTLQLQPGYFPKTYLWNGVSTAVPNKTYTLSSPGNTITCTIYGCNNVPVTTSINASALIPNLCMVTVDATTGKNMIVFEKPSDYAIIDSFIVYRQGSVTNDYIEIGGLKTYDYSTFIDETSNPSQEAYYYELAYKDSTGYTTPLSAYHETMHLSINKGNTNTAWNLIWNEYVGVSATTYKIYRGLSLTTMSLIDSVAGNITSYTDTSAPVTNTIYYQIGITGVTCNPSARTEAISGIVSNYVTTSGIAGAVSQTTTAGVTIYPNPASESFFITGVNGVCTVKLENMQGVTVKQYAPGTSNSYSIGELQTGIYFVEIVSSNGVYVQKLMVK